MFLRIAAVVLALCLWLPAPTLAATPKIVGVEGYLYSPGGPAPDGDYYMTFNVLDAQKGNLVWTEGSVKVSVKGGQFNYGLGTAKALDPGVMADSRWLEIGIGSDPVMPAVPMRSVWAALRAAVADSVDCSGCIGAAQLDPKALLGYVKSTDLGGFAKSADLNDYVKANALAKVSASGSYKDLADLPKLADVATTGAYADLLGLPALAKVGTSCGTGLLVKGIKADGSLDCAAGGVSVDTLPKDGLDEISNGLLTNQFSEVAASVTAPIAIPDAFGAGVSDTIDVPDIGIAQSLVINVDLSNSDISKVRVTVFDPVGGTYKLYDQGGTGIALKQSYPTDAKPVAGDLGAWAGKNPKGQWSINVADLAGTSGGKDGKLNAWSVQVNYLSTKKVAATSSLQLVPQKTAPLPCNPGNMGLIYFDAVNKAISYCDGAVWRNLADTCGNGVLDKNEECDDGNNANGDGCSSTCVASYGWAKAKPGQSCLDIQTKLLAAKEKVPDGTYWIAAPKGQVIQVVCDMTTEGGGYTYFAVDAGKTTFKATDDNTCKDYGLDIMFPRSKDQWTWVLGKFGNSYFNTIPGVFRNGGGGSYTGCIMRDPKAYGGNSCSDWQVGDGGRWWLRDSTYSEPNGDYQPPCWLSMYQWDPNDIRFNDGTCSYSTSKYLCSTNDKK